MGNIPNGNPNASIIRQIDTTSPIKGADNPDLNCGADAQLAQSQGSANPGDVLAFDWRGGDLSKWPHNTGPLMFYMTSCPSSGCASYNSSSAKWFKIDQLGMYTNGSWVQVTLKQGGLANVTLPKDIAPGEYILRHEIIALHLGNSLGGAEFYPSCTQLTIGGSGTGVPSDDELVTFPGGYSDNDPGIYDPNVYTPGAPYTFPGPPIAKLAMATAGQPGSSTSSSSSSGSSSSGSSSSGSTGSTGAAAQSAIEFCLLKPPKTGSQSYLGRRFERFPHELRHTIRNLWFSH